MSNTQESCVSTQDTFRLIETEEKTSSVTALVSRLNLRSSKDDEQREDKSIVQIFPWLPKINDLCRSSVGSKNIKTLENLLTVYLQKITASVKECYLKPIRAGKLKTCMNETLVFFHFLYQDIKESVDNTLYLEKMTELMAMYIDMEIKSARRRKETVKKVVSRMTSALHIFLDRSENHILDAIMKAKYITTNDKEICSPILEKLLTSVRTYNMNDTLYVRYLLVFKLWKKIVADANRRKEINKLAIARLPPPANFADRYKRFNNVLPRMPNSKNITTFYMQAKLNIKTACQNFMKISKDPMQPVVVDKPFYYDGRSQSTFSGKGNPFDGGVSRNLMNEIWSSFSEDNATSNKKTKDNSTAKKKTKKNSPEKEKKKKKKTKSESTDNFSESNSPSDVSGSHLLQDSVSVPDAVTSSASIDQASGRGLDFKPTTFNSARTTLRDAAPSTPSDLRPLPDSSTSSTTQDIGTTRLPSYFETKPVQDLISTSCSVDLKPHLQPSYDCTVTSGIYVEDHKPSLHTLTMYTTKDMARTDEAAIGIHLRENSPVGTLESMVRPTDNDPVEIKVEDNQDRCINAVVEQETKPSIDDLYTYSKTQLLNVKPNSVKKKQATKTAVPVITIEDLPDPEIDLNFGLFKECEVQLGDQDLPYIEEEVIEPCDTESNSAYATSDDKSGMSVNSVVSSSDCDPVESHCVSSSHYDKIVERKPLRIALNSCIPLNVRRDMLSPRLNVTSPNSVVNPPSRAVISSSQAHLALPSHNTSSPQHSAQSSPLAVSSPLIQVASPQLVEYLQPQVKAPSPPPMVVPSPQPPAFSSQFKVPFPPLMASPTKSSLQLATSSLHSEDFQLYDEVGQTNTPNQPELYGSPHHSSVGHITPAVAHFDPRDEYKFSPEPFSFDNDSLSFTFSPEFDLFGDSIYSYPHISVDPHMLDARPRTEDQESINSSVIINPMELSNERAIRNEKWPYETPTNDAPTTMPLMADDDDDLNYPPFVSEYYSSRKYLTSDDANKTVNEVLSQSDSSQLNSMYRNSIPDTCDKDSSSQSNRMTNAPINSVSNSFQLEETGPSLRKSLESSEDSFHKLSLINSSFSIDPTASGQSRFDKPVTSRSKHSARHRNFSLVNKYDERSSVKQDMTRESADLEQYEKRKMSKQYVRTTPTNKQPGMESIKVDTLQANSALMECSVKLSPLGSKDISLGLIKTSARGGMLNSSTGRPYRPPTTLPYHIPIPYAIPNPAGPGKPPLYHCRDCYIHIQQQYLLYKYNASLQVASRYQHATATSSYPSPIVKQIMTVEQSDTEVNEEIRKMVKEYEMRTASESKRAIESDQEGDAVNQTDAESKNKWDINSSLPPKKRHKVMAVEKHAVSFPSYPTRPMMSIAELEEEKIKLQVSGIQNNELENAKKREEIVARYKKPVKVPFDQLKPSQPVIQRNVASQQEKVKVNQPVRSYPAPTRATSENVNFAGSSESSGRTFKTPGQLKEHNSFNFRASPYIGEYGQIVYPQNYNESMSQKESMILKRLSYVEQPKPSISKVNILDLSVAPEHTSKERKSASSSKRKSKDRPNAGTRTSKRKNQSVIKKTRTIESSDSKRRRKDASR